MTTAQTAADITRVTELLAIAKSHVALPELTADSVYFDASGFRFTDAQRGALKAWADFYEAAGRDRRVSLPVYDRNGTQIASWVVSA